MPAVAAIVMRDMTLRTPLCMLALLCAFGLPLNAETLSVVPLAKALQNSDLFGDSPQDARANVRALMVNQPTEAELPAFHERLALLARHKDTRLGKLFFRALETMPGIDNLPADARHAELIVRRPLELAAVVRVHAGFERVGDVWRVARLEVGLEGAGASPVAAAAPFFGSGRVEPLILDARELELLVGRDVESRHEGRDFDYDAALADYLKLEEGAFTAVIKKLREAVTPRTERNQRIAALKPHMSADAARAMERADADDKQREAFWSAVFKQLDAAAAAAAPTGVPVRRGGSVMARVHDAARQELSQVQAERLASGEVAPRIRAE